MSNPHLMYEFRNDAGEIEPLYFSDPVNIFQTHDLANVANILEKVDQAVNDGFTQQAMFRTKQLRLSDRKCMFNRQVRCRSFGLGFSKSHKKCR